MYGHMQSKANEARICTTLQLPKCDPVTCFLLNVSKENSKTMFPLSSSSQIYNHIFL